MTALSNFAENSLCDHILGTAAYTAPAAIYLKLHTGDPGEDCTGNASAETERKVVTFAAAVGGVATVNGTLPSWDPWDQGAETVSHFSVWDAAVAGNPLLKGAFTASKTMADGDAFELAAGTTVTFD